MRPGILTISGLEHLNSVQVVRLKTYLSVWWLCRSKAVGAAYHLLFLLASVGPATELQQSLSFRVIRLPMLSERREDLPHVLHATASAFGGSLEDFSPEAIAQLIADDWAGGLAEIRSLFRRLYTESEGDGTFSPEEIGRALRDIRASKSPAPPDTGDIVEDYPRPQQPL